MKFLYNLLSNKKILNRLLLLTLIFSPFITFVLSNFDKRIFLTKIFFVTILITCFAIFIFCILLNKLTLLVRPGIRSILLLKLSIFIAYNWYFQFFYSDIKSFVPIDNYDGYITLAIIVAISMIFSHFSLRKRFVHFVLLFLFLNIGVSFTKISLISSFKQIKSIEKKDEINLSDKTNFENKVQPNIFFIIPDMLGSLNVLEKNFNIKSSKIQNELINKGFKIAQEAKSSYNITQLTLTSIFALDYMLTENSQRYSDNNKLYPRYLKINKKIPLFDQLNILGYEFTMVSHAWWKCDVSWKVHCINPLNDNLIQLILDDYSLNAFLRNSVFSVFVPLIPKDFYIDANDSIKTLSDNLKKNSYIWDKGGVFTFVHSNSPHPPYRSKDCNLLSVEERSFKSVQNYTSSVQCAFLRISEITDLIHSKYPDALIIIQSDHGPQMSITDGKYEKLSFNEQTESVLEERLSIFNAAHLPNLCKNDFSNNMGTVETIRLVLTCVGAIDLPYEKKSKTYFGFHGKNADFGKVYRVY